MWPFGNRPAWQPWFRNSVSKDLTASRSRRRRDLFRALRLEPLERRQLLTANVPYVTLTVNDTLLDESGEEARVTAQLTATTSQTVTVKLGFSGTASRPSDYSISGTSITISPGKLTGSMIVRAVDNATYEQDETVTVSISSVTNGCEQGQQAVTITIDDNDVAPTVTLLATNNPIAENGGTTRVVAQLSNTSAVPVNLSLNFTGTATNGIDYSRSAASICIPANSLTGSITIVGRDDTLIEGTEQIVVSLGSCQDGIIGAAASVSINILDDDQQQTAPTAVNDALTPVAEDSAPRSISFASLLGNDLIPSGSASSTIVAVGSAVGGSVAISGTNVIFTPTANYNGPASFVYTLQVPGTPAPLTSQATASFTITEVNDVPVGVNDTSPNMVEDDSPRTFTFASLLANDSRGPANEASQTLTITSVSAGVGGAVAIVSGNVVFTPTPNYFGPASFVYTLQDNGTTNSAADPKTATATVNFTITEVNDAPTAGNDTLSTIAEDSAARTISFASLLGNDSTGPANESSQTLTITGVGSAVGGTVAIVGTDVIFTPAANYNGPASFVYTVQDNGTTNGAADPKTATATVNFTITEVNDAPTAGNDTLSTIAEDSAARTISFASLLGNDTTGPANESSQTLTITGVGSAVGGTVAIVGTDVIFTPAANYNGPASFVYTLQDNGTTNGIADPKSATATVSFTITEVNDAPTAANDTLSTIAEDSGPRTISFTSLLGNDSTGPANESSQTLTITGVGSAVGGTVAIVGTDVIFTPAANYNGPASFVYTVQDNGTTNGVADPKSAAATVSFTITEVNDAPTAGNDTLSTIAEDSGARTISFASLLGNDTTGPANEASQTLTITGVGSAVGGTVAIVGTDVIFTPAANYNGPASFVYTVQDNGTTNGAADPKTATATVSFLIAEINSPPVAGNDTLSAVAEDSNARTISFASLLANDVPGPINEAGQTLTITGVSSAVGGTVAIVGTDVIFTPAANYNGPASFVYTVQDNGTTAGLPDPQSATGSVSFTITEVNDAPTAGNDTLADVVNTGPVSIPISSLLANDSPGPANEASQTLTLISLSNISGGTATIVGSDIVFTPTAGLEAPGGFQYTIVDNGTTASAADPLTAVGTVSFNIISPPNIPPAVDLNGVGVPGTSYPAVMTLIGGTVSVVNAATATVVDPDTDILSGTITITNRLDGLSEVLAVNTAGTSLSASFNSASGVLTLTGLATPAEYQQVIRTTTYTNLSFNPTMSPDRVIQFVLDDGEDLSNVAEATVNYAIVPSPPEVDLDGSASVNFSYAADYLTYNGPVKIAAADATLIDTSNVYLASLTVTLVTPSDGLLEVLAANTTGTPITSSYAMNGLNAVLTLSGLGTVAQYEQVLRTVTYDNMADLPTIQSRLIKVVANDGTFNSSERLTTLNVIAVNGKPKITTTSGVTPYVRGNLAGAVVDAGLTVSDPGGVQFQSATIAITSGFVPGIDRLSYNGAGGIPSSFNATTGVLTLTGFTSIANYQTALRAIKFVTLSSAAIGPRTISFSVRDVTAATNGHLWSDPATKTVNVTAAELATVTNFDAVVPLISSADLRPIVDEAIARWQRAGASPTQVNLLRNTPVTIADLDESASLGTTDGQSITLDDDAAGIGWFVDPTPRNDREFDERVGRFERQADDGAAAGQYDLLTVVMHEFGHVLGLDDLDAAQSPHQLMTAELTLGTRRLAPLGRRDANGEMIWYAQSLNDNSDHGDKDDERDDRSGRDSARLRRELIDRLFTYWS